MNLRYALILITLLFSFALQAQTTAWYRANKMGKGINLSWMDQRWNGTAYEEQRDYLDLEKLPYIKEQIDLMHELGFQLLRFPVCFELWYDENEPYKLVKPEYYPALDSVIRWTAEKNMLLIIDNHHGTLRAEHLAEDTKRICAVWTDVARRYKNTDADRLFFELFNEPNQLDESDWANTALQIISAMRTQAPAHTLIVGASEWNGWKALQHSAPFADTNIIYTFHFYDPFLYTHQGAEWAGDAALTTGLPYPYRSKDMPAIDPQAAKTWAAGPFQAYSNDATYASLDNNIKRIKEWSKEHNVPIFCGEWGAYKNFAAVPDRCTYLKDVYTILHTHKIPNAMWEWDAGFSFFDGQPSSSTIIPCMKGIVESK